MSNKFKFVDLPEQIELEEYNQAIEYFVNIISKIKGVVSIYEMGSVSAPGISDLDLLVIIKDDFKEVPQLKKAINQCTNNYKRLFMHPVDITTVSLFEHIKLYDPVHKLKKHYGKSLAYTDINSRNMDLIWLVDLINSHWPYEHLKHMYKKSFFYNSQFLRVLIDHFLLKIHFPGFLKDKKGYVPVRFVLCRINSMKFPLIMLQRLTNKEYPEWKKVLDDIDSFRKNWFELGDEKYSTLLELMEKTIKISVEMIAEVRSILKESKILDIKSDKTMSIYSFDMLNTYNKEWDVSSSLNESLEYLKQFNQPISILPLEFFPQISYFQGIDKFILPENLNLENYRIVDPDYLDLLKKHYHYLDLHNKHLSKLNLDFGSFLHFNINPSYTSIFKFYIKFDRFMNKIFLKHKLKKH